MILFLFIAGAGSPFLSPRWRTAAPSWWAAEPCEVGGQRGAEGWVLSDKLTITYQYSMLIDNPLFISNPRWRWLPCEVCPQIAASSPPHRSSLPVGAGSAING